MPESLRCLICRCGLQGLIFSGRSARRCLRSRSGKRSPMVISPKRWAHLRRRLARPVAAIRFR
ncbi:UNVERIFIED_CONTAM: hypothetical protein GTU68_020611 [Idotea baltica]|nr:hypothetical protein [Idotea baltica]